MLKDCTTLVVDDQELNREILREILKGTGQVLTAADGAEALRLLEQQGDKIEGIILDLVMPVMDGYQFLERFRALEQYKNIPVIVATAEVDVATEHRCLQMGAWDLVRKPYDPFTLLLRLQNSVERSRLQKLEEQQWENAFSRYVGPAVLRAIKDSGSYLSPGQLAVRPEDITVLFADIRGFTTLSQRLPARDVADILNRFFTEVTACVWETGGTIDKYMGDCIMAEWNALLPCEDQVYAGCRAAREILGRTEGFFRELADRYGCPVGVGIGVHHGRAVVGNIGTPQRMDYTCIGDVVNTAQRLESAAFSGSLFISRAVADSLGPRARVRRVEQVHLRSKDPDFEVYLLEQLR